MNNKGFGLNEVLIFTGIAALVLIYAVITLQQSLKAIEINEISTYEDMENELTKASKTYVNEKYGTYEGNIEIKITKKVLKKENVSFTDINDSNIECDGYVIYSKDGNSEKYTPYLKCGNNYKTDGFAD